MTRRERAKERVADARAAASERVAEPGRWPRSGSPTPRPSPRSGSPTRRPPPRSSSPARSRAFAASRTSGPSSSRWSPAARWWSRRRAARATAAVAIYAASLSALLGVSALYHRINWRRPEIRRWMRRLDHSMIFLLIAGTVTPFAVLVLDGTLANALLIAVWAGAAAGIVVELVWVEAPKWVDDARLPRGRLDRRPRLPRDRRQRGTGRGRPDRRRRRPLHRGRGDLRAPAAGPEPGGLRLPRDLPPAGDRRRRGPLRRRGDLRPAGGLSGPAGHARRLSDSTSYRGARAGDRRRLERGQPSRRPQRRRVAAAGLRGLDQRPSSSSRPSRTSSTGSGSPLTIPSKNSLRSW